MTSVPAGTEPPRLSAIWAQARGGVIGLGGAMPWSVPADLAFFKSTTSGCPVIMGRSTWESFPERFRPLPGRTNIVLTGSIPTAADTVDGNAHHDGAIWTDSITKALSVANEAPRSGNDLWIIGGSRVYEQALGLADLPGVIDGRLTRAVVTELDVTVPGDRCAPELDSGWAMTELGSGVEERGSLADADGVLHPAHIAYRFLEFTR